MDSSKLIDPVLWVQSGGLIGLVIFALFAALGIFLWAQLKIYEMHRSDIKTMHELHAKEREYWGNIIDTRQRETNAAIAGMSAAINELAHRHRRYDDHQ